MNLAILRLALMHGAYSVYHTEFCEEERETAGETMGAVVFIFFICSSFLFSFIIDLVP